jgi:hypothetical protein
VQSIELQGDEGKTENIWVGDKNLGRQRDNKKAASGMKQLVRFLCVRGGT